MKKVILYGGAFNPPTNAHLAILNACINVALTSGSKVWVMPSGTRDDKSIEGNFENRMKLVESLVEASMHSSEVCISDLELRTPGLTHTYDTYKALQNRFPEMQFVWVFGADSVGTMKSWSHGAELWKKLHMLIVPREGYELAELPPLAEILSVDSPLVSSTHVRSCVSQGLDYAHLVPSTVHVAMQQLLGKEAT